MNDNDSTIIRRVRIGIAGFGSGMMLASLIVTLIKYKEISALGCHGFIVLYLAWVVGFALAFFSLRRPAGILYISQGVDKKTGEPIVCIAGIESTIDVDEYIESPRVTYRVVLETIDQTCERLNRQERVKNSSHNVT